jgi:serine phosphatase RsbU (regulator of sigma subunit)
MKKLFLDFFWTIPTNLPISKHRDYRVNAVIGLCGFVAHVLFISLFAFFEVYPMVIFNLFSIAIFAYIVIQNKINTKKYLIIICNLEVVLHAIAATYYLGFASSFHFYAFLMFQGIFILTTYKNINWFLGTFSILSYLFIIWLVQHHAPVIPFLKHNGIQFYSYINLVCAAGICILLSFYFRNTADAAENILLVSNEKLNLQNITMEQQGQEILVQKKQTEKAFHLLNESVEYAKRIQDAFLPLPSALDAIFGKENYFVLFMPKHTVSGDFYFLEQQGNNIYLAVADCTGHGVSGAMMSLIGMNALSRIINHGEITNPSIILNELHKTIKNTLKQEETNTNDGMEIAVCVIDKTKQTINFAGAGASLILIEKNVLNTVKGNRFPVGGRNHVNETERIFDLQCITYTPNTQLYLYTDGYQDQFGEISNTRYTSRKLNETFLAQNSLNLKDQLAQLKINFDNWKKTTIQVDDVLVVGIKL